MSLCDVCLCKQCMCDCSVCVCVCVCVCERVFQRALSLSLCIYGTGIHFKELAHGIVEARGVRKLQGGLQGGDLGQEVPFESEGRLLQNFFLLRASPRSPRAFH